MIRLTTRLKSSPHPSTPEAPNAIVLSDAEAILTWAPCQGEEIVYDVVQDSDVIASGLTTPTFKVTTGQANATIPIKVIARNSRGAVVGGKPSLVAFKSYNGTGGEVIEYNGYRIHIFRQNGTFTPETKMKADVIICGGGGGGGRGNTFKSFGWMACADVNNDGGGGGGGEVIAKTVTINNPVAIRVGAGGSGGKGRWPADAISYHGSPGGDSAFGTVVARGGRGGKSMFGIDSGYVVVNGVSMNKVYRTNGAGGASGNGNPGGVGSFAKYGGGGGSSASRGGDGFLLDTWQPPYIRPKYYNRGGNGAEGTIINYLPSLLVLGSGGGAGSNNRTDANNMGSEIAYGGTFAGHGGNGNTLPTAGTYATGAGGGGSTSWAERCGQNRFEADGADGGSGIVMVRYKIIAERDFIHPPTTPGIPVISNLTATSATITWNPSMGDGAVVYDLYVDGLLSPSMKGIPTNTFELTQLAVHTEVSVIVVARIENSCSQSTAEVKFKTYQQPVLMLEFDNPALITDSSIYENNAWEAIPNVSFTRLITTEDKIYGISSFTGQTARLKHALTPSLSLGTGDFTIQFWVKPLSTQPQQTNYFVPLCGADRFTNAGLFILQDQMINKILWYPVGVRSSAIPNDAWTHVRLVRYDNVSYIFINGILDCEPKKDTLDLTSLWYRGIHIGCEPNAGRFFTGGLDNFQIFNSSLGVVNFPVNSKF